MMWKPIFSKLLVIFIFTLIVLPIFIFSQGESVSSQGSSMLGDGILWGSEHRVTWMGNSQKPVIAADGEGNFHIVWQDHRNGNWDIYYVKVDMNGFKLLNDTRLTTYAGDDINPSMVAYGDRVYVVWQRYADSHWSIYFTRISYTYEDIAIEVSPKVIVDDGNNCTNPMIVRGASGYLYMVWQEYRQGNWDIMYMRLNDDGVPLMSPEDVSQDTSNSTKPDIAVDTDGNLQIFWVDEKPIPGYAVLYRKIAPSGKFLSEVKKISVVSPQTTVNSAVYGNKIYTVFSCSRENLAYEVIYTQLNYAGDTILDDRNLTPLDGIDSVEPHIGLRDSNILLLWDDVPMGVVRFSIFNSTGWRIGEIVNLSAPGAYEPDMALNLKSIGIVWEKMLNGKSYLFFRSGRIGNVKINSLHLHGYIGGANVNFTLYAPWQTKVTYAIYSDSHLRFEGNAVVNGESNLTVNLTLSPGKHEIEVIVDPGNRLIEYEKHDNSLEGEVFVPSFSFLLEGKDHYILSPGEMANITFYLKNTGNMMDNYTLNLTYLREYFVITHVPVIHNVSVNESREISLWARVLNYTLAKEYKLGVRVTSMSTGVSLWKNITLQISESPAMEIGYSSPIYVKPGETARVEFTLLNTGNCNDTYFVNFTQEKPWPFVTPQLWNFTLAPREQKTFSIEIIVPPGERGYSENNITFTVESMHNISRKFSVRMVVQPVHNADAKLIEVEKNTSHYRATVSVINTGNVRDAYSLSLSGKGAPYSYMQPSYLTLSPGERSNVVIDSYLPSNLTSGEYPLIFSVLLGNKTLTSLTISLSVEPVHGISVSITQLSTKKVQFVLNIRNTGNAPDVIHIYHPILQGIHNTTWLFEVAGKNYTNETTVYLKPNGTVEVLMLLATGIKEGNHHLNLTLLSASGIKKNISMEFYAGIKKKSIFEIIVDVIMDNLIYIVIAVAVAVVAVVYLKKFRK